MTPEQIALQVAVSIITGIVVAYVTVLLALNRFRQERWWEKKLEAYTDIVMALHHIKRDLDAEFLSLQFQRDRPKQDPLSEKHKESRAELERIVAMGELLISDRAMKILGDLFRGMEAAGEVAEEQGYVMYVDGYLGAVIGCLAQIKPEAKADLKIGAMQLPWHRKANRQHL